MGFERRRSGAVLLVGAAVLAIVGVAEPAPSLFTTHQIGARILWATALGALILGAAMTPPRFLERGPLPFLGRISYSVYLLHPVVLLAFGAFGGAALLTSLGVGRTLTYALAAAICSAVVILLSWGTFRLIEAPGMAVGRRLVRRAREREVSATLTTWRLITNRLSP